MGKKLLYAVSFFYLLIGFSLNANGQCVAPGANASVTISQTNGSNNICSDETISFSVNNINTDGGSTDYTLQWQVQLNNGSWTNISSETSSNLTNYSPAIGNNRIRLEVTFCDNTVIHSSQSSIITVNQRKTGSVTISASKTTICPGETVNFSISSVQNAGSSASYEWKVNGTTEGTSSSFSSSTIPNGASIQLFITSSQPCVDPFSSNVINVTHKAAAPDNPASISGDAQVCPNTSGITYSISSVDRATSYQWTLPNGWSGNSTSESITVTSGNVANNQVIKVKAINECGESTDQTLSVNVGPGKPATPGAISDPGIICPGSSITLNVTNDSSVNSYTWQVPSGWNITNGQGTNEITVTAGNYGQNGTVSVYSTNDCLDSDTSSKNFTINEPAPATPGTVSGNDIVCPNTDITYSIDAVQYTDEYIWYFDGTEVSGQNGTSITINSANPGSKEIKVIAVNECSDSDYSTITASTKTIIVDDGTPDATSISQPNGEQNFCPGETGIVFSVPADSKIDTYDWQLPSGWSVTAGTGTNQITVTAGQLGNDGQITLTGSSNDCGSITATYDVFVKDPAPVITSETISGETEVCHDATGLTYTIPEVEYANNYAWSVPGNWNITAGQGSNSITVSAGTDNGNITVIASNDCGDSSEIILNVSSIDNTPPALGTIFSDPGTVSQVCPPAEFDFWVDEVSGADSYTWSLPPGWEILSGENTNRIHIKVTNSAAYNNENVTVFASNICGDTQPVAYTDITVSDYIITDLGEDQTVCTNQSQIAIPGEISFGSAKKFNPTYSAINGSGTNVTSNLSNLPSNTSNYPNNFTFYYNPTANDIASGSVTVSVQVPKPVTNKNDPDACGTGHAEMTIFFRPDPTASISATSEICTGQTAEVTITATANTTVTYKIGSGSNQTIQIGDSGTATLTTSALNSTTSISLVNAQYTQAPSCTKTIAGSATVTVNPVPAVDISYSSPYCHTDNTAEVSFANGVGAYTDGTFSSTGSLSTAINSSDGSFNPSNVDPGTYTVTYKIPASGGCGEVSVTTEVTILEEVAITQQPEGSRLCEGGDAHFEVSATGDGLTYQWYKDAATSGNEIGGATSASLDISNISASDAGDYFVIVSGSSTCSPVTSVAATLAVDENIIVETQPETQTVCEGGAVTFSVSATSGGIALTSDYSYQWYKGTPGSGTAITSATQASLTIDPVSPSDDGDYYVEITGSSEFQCEPTLSEAASLTVRPTPTVDISEDTSICSGTSADISFTNGIPNGIVTYTLNNNNTNPQTFTLDASGAGTLNTGNLSATDGDSDGKLDNTEFVYEIQSVAYSDAPECNSNLNSSVTITVSPVPTPVISFPNDQIEFCTADDTSYNPSLTGEGTFAEGTFSANGGLNINSSTGAFVPSSQNAGDYTITYTYPAAGGCGEGTATLDISIYEEVTITSEPYNIGICSTQDAEFSVTATGDNLTYQWYKDGSLLSGETSATLSLPVATSEDAGEYYVMVSGTNVCTPDEDSQVESEHAFLTVDEDIVIIEPAEDVKVCATGEEDVHYRFVVHANGAPLKFEWIYGDGTPVPVDGDDPSGRYTTTLTPDSSYGGFGFTVYIGTLSIENVTDADEGSYAVRIDGSENGFNCSEAISNAFKLEVDPLPDGPVVSDVEYCTGETPDALTAEGENLQWYDVDMNPLSSAPVPVTDTEAEFTYYVTQTPLYCESNPSQIKVFVYARPGKPAVDQTEIDYCLGETASPLEATADEGATLNWYDSETATTPLSEAPTPQINSQGDIFYWVSQTNENTCEGEREKITVHIHKLPSITPIEDQTICEGTEITLSANDENVTDNSTSFTWEDSDGNTLTGSSITITPSETTSYTITGANSNGCINTEEVTINVDPAPNGGTLAGPASVCENNISGTITLTDHEGTIDHWEYMDSTTSDWTAITNTSGMEEYDLSDFNMTEATKFRAVLTSGVCEEAYSSEHTVGIDRVPVGGILKFDDNDDRVFMICENPESGYASDLTLHDSEGEVIKWEYRNGTSGWQSIPGETGITLSASKIESIISNQSTAFRVEIGSGACIPNKFSETAIISVIPSDIEPSPVQVTPRVVCKGELVTLNSETGYGSEFGKFEGGAFDNSSITNKGWRITDKNGVTNYDFSSNADNIRPDKWLRTNPHDYITAGLDSPYTVGLDWWESKEDPSGNKGFAIVSGDNASTLETPVFNLTGLDEAVLTFDQAFNLVNGASIAVEISTDGGKTYNTTLYSITADASPAKGKTSGNYDHFSEGTPDVNQIEIDLGDYLYQSNLRIRFNFKGANDGDLWTLDNIKVPEGPRDITLEWRDYSDPTTYPDGEFIGNNNTEQWEPKLIGWNNFEVKTKIILDSNGTACSSIENAKDIQVFVFDQYVTSVTAQAGSCGSFQATLSAEVAGDFGGPVNSYPTADGYIGQWYIEINGSEADPSTYTLSNADDSSTLDPINDPEAIFEANNTGDYVFTWQLIATEVYPDNYFDETLRGEIVENTGCPPTTNPQTTTLTDCTTLDFDGIDDYITIQDNFGEAQSVEMWVYPEASTGTIYSSPGRELTMADLSAYLSSNTRWYHVAIVGNKVYIDGIDVGKTINGTGTTGQTLIGGKWDSASKSAINLFSGWIEEVRIWKQSLTPKQIHFMMNQRLKVNGIQVATPLEGEVVPNRIIDALSSYHNDGTYNLDSEDEPFYDINANDLLGYYRLISNDPDPANLITFDSALMPSGGYTPNLAPTGVDGRLHNMTTDQQNTSPTPYFSGNDGDWDADATWARPDVWDPPNSDDIEWNIARINHNISGKRDITMLGLLSETAGKELTIEASHPIRITHYLLLNGNMDLEGESQLLQDHGSILDNSSTGWAEIDQQGRMSSFNYNYWSSPVSNQGSDNNSGYMLNQVLRDGSPPNNNPPKVTFKDGYFVADGAKTSPITISNEWIWDFRGGDADIYGDWLHLGSDYTEIVGAGYSMKGTTGNAGLGDKQNYVFRGKPNNGDIPKAELYLNSDQNYLVGNPYPSAIDADKFLRDNLVNVGTGTGDNVNDENVFNGTLYYWDHFAGQTHILEEYIGGYATYTLSGSAPAISNDWRINDSNPNASGGKDPQQYIPVAQGFFLNSAPVGNQTFGGDIIFNNTQRIYVPKSNNNSIFLAPVKATKSKKSPISDKRAKIRLKFNSPAGYHRQILVTRDENTTNGFDIGYDAPLIEDNVEDMYWWFEDHGFVIQGVPDFEEEQVLPLAIKVQSEGQFTIRIDSTENWPTQKEIYLKDNKLDTIHNIGKEAYKGTSEIGEIKERFELVFFKPTPDIVDNPDELPVIDNLVDISYSRFDKQVKISNEDLLKVSKVLIFDMRGKLIQEFDELPTEREILLGMRPVRSAVYIVKVYCENGICNKKIIVK